MNDRETDLCSEDSTKTAYAGAQLELLDWFSASLLQAKLGFNSRNVCINSLLKMFGATVICIVSLCRGAK